MFFARQLHAMNANVENLNGGYKDLQKTVLELSCVPRRRPVRTDPTTSTPSSPYHRVQDSEDSAGSDGDDEGGGRRTTHISRRKPKQVKDSVRLKLSSATEDLDIGLSEKSVAMPLYFYCWIPINRFGIK